MSDLETREGYARQFPMLTPQQLDGRIEQDAISHTMEELMWELCECRAFKRLKMSSRSAKAAVGYLIESIAKDDLDDAEMLPPPRDVFATALGALDALIRDAEYARAHIRSSVKFVDGTGWWSDKEKE